MSALSHRTPVSRWHHRVLGGIWAFFGLEVAKETMPLRSDYGRWIILGIALVCVAAGIGFIFRYIWARGFMWVLMGIVEFFFFCGILASGRTLDYVVVGVATYTFLFLANSAASHFEIMINTGRA
jgi:hypothetical protein